MSKELENVLKQLNDISVHKQFVIASCHKMAEILFKEGKNDLALQLMARAFKHDASKLLPDEFYGMSRFADDTSSLKDPNKSLESEKQKYIDLHWQRNKHHPEYWQDVIQMEEIDILEMACDWYARSTQFESDLLEFVKTRQKNRFHFPQEFYQKLLTYCEILVKQ